MACLKKGVDKMADYENKYIDAEGVKHLWKKAEEIYIKKDGNKGLSESNFTAEEKEKLQSLENYSLPNASSETLGGIKIGSGLLINEDGVVSTFGTPAGAVTFENVLNKPTTLEGYGITDGATKEELENIQFDSLSQMDIDMITRSATTVESLRILISQGGEVDLGCDLNVTETIIVTDDVILNMNKCRLSSTDDNTIFLVDRAVMTIRNGYTHSFSRLASTTNYGSIRFENVLVD